MDTPIPRNETPDLIGGLDRGDPTAVGPMMSRHHKELLAIAKRLLRRYGISAAEFADDDPVNETMFAICRLAKAGKLAPIRTRKGWWTRVSSILKRKVRLVRDGLRRQKRGGEGIARPGQHHPPNRGTTHDPRIGGTRHQYRLDELDEPASPVPDAVRRVADADEFQCLLERLDSDVLRQIVILARDGHTIEEIAGRLGLVPRTIQRKLNRIRLAMIDCGFLT